MGVNFFDNAEMYGDGYAEEVMGRALRASGYERSQYYVATKVSESYLEPSLLKEHLDASLARIGVDCIDLYQLHWASRAAVKTAKYPERPLPEEVPLEDTLAALEECKAAGKIKHIGVCNFGVSDLKRALATGTKIVSNQICYNLLWYGKRFWGGAVLVYRDDQFAKTGSGQNEEKLRRKEASSVGEASRTRWFPSASRTISRSCPGRRWGRACLRERCSLQTKCSRVCEK
jgi:hypothetical protein